MATSGNSCEVSKELGFVNRVSIVPKIVEVVITSRSGEGYPLDRCKAHGVVKNRDGRRYVLGSGSDNGSGNEIYHNVTNVFDLTVRERPDCDLVRRG